MAQQWFYAVNNERRGPVSEAELQQLARDGAVTGETLVWAAGMAQWQRAREFPGLLPAAPPAMPEEPVAMAPADAAAALPQVLSSTPQPAPARPQRTAPPVTSGLAIGALICGIAGLLLCPAALAGLILGIIALGKIKASHGAEQGRGLAIAGIILSSFALLLAPVAIIAAIAIPNLLRSRMAANETAAIAACKAFAEAEDIYRRTDYNRDGVLEYAQHLSGTDSLYETRPGLGDNALIDRSFACAEGNPLNVVPKAGYVFKVLTAQGYNAPGGAHTYMSYGGHMTLGYGLCAVPNQYDGTGRNTFIISNAGTIYQKDRGQYDTGFPATYDPDVTWVVAE
jgi:hypothetical protein